MKKDEIQAELKSLGDRIILLSKLVSEIKEEEEQKGAKEIDFEGIERVGGKYPIKGHYISNKDFYEKGLYIDMLISIAMTDENDVYDRLIFIERIKNGIGYNNKLSEEYKNALLIDNNKVDEFVKSLDEVEKISFVIDCFMMCGDINSCCDELKKYISEICLLFNIDKKMLLEIINVSKVMLSQSLDVFSWDYDFDYSVFAKNFRYYLPVAELERYRVEVEFPERVEEEKVVVGSFGRKTKIITEYIGIKNIPEKLIHKGEDIIFEGKRKTLEGMFGHFEEKDSENIVKKIKCEKTGILDYVEYDKFNIVHTLDYVKTDISDIGDEYIEKFKVEGFDLLDIKLMKKYGFKKEDIEHICDVIFGNPFSNYARKDHFKTCLKKCKTVEKSIKELEKEYDWEMFQKIKK